MYDIIEEVNWIFCNLKGWVSHIWKILTCWHPIDFPWNVVSSVAHIFGSLSSLQRRQTHGSLTHWNKQRTEIFARVPLEK